MKKTIKFLAVGAMAVSLIACKKKEETPVADNTADATVVVDSLSAGDHAGHDHATTEDASLAATKKNPSTTVALSESDFSFGTIKKGESKSHTYEITNTGKNPLIISEVKPGCGCTVPDFTKEPILPGKKGQITLKFDSSNFDGAVSKAADIFANVENAPIRIGFTADIVN